MTVYCTMKRQMTRKSVVGNELCYDKASARSVCTRLGTHRASRLRLSYSHVSFIHLHFLPVTGRCSETMLATPYLWESILFWPGRADEVDPVVLDAPTRVHITPPNLKSLTASTLTLTRPPRLYARPTTIFCIFVTTQETFGYSTCVWPPLITGNYLACIVVALLLTGHVSS
jgi:hypothetical protein